MIGKVTRGADIGGLVRYLTGPGRHEEHTRPHVIGTSLGIDVPLGRELNADERRHLATQLDGPRLGFGTEIDDGHVWHLSLTNRADDRELSDDEWADAVREVLAAQGFDRGGEGPGCPWAAFRHGRSQAGNDHVHVAVSLVREDGTRASNWRDRVTLSRSCRELEERLGLVVVAGRTAGATPAPGRAELESAERRGQPEPDRTRLGRLVRAAASASRDEAEFVRRLRAQDILVRPRDAPRGQAGVVGYSVAVTPQAASGGGRHGGSPVWYGGGRLAKDLTLPKLRAHWQPVADQHAAWHTSGGTGGGTGPEGGERPREETPIAARAWHEAARRARAANDRLAAVDPGDRLAWAQAAQEAAGVMSSLAGRLEVARPGPLSDAADSLARSAQNAATARTGGRDLAGLAAVAAQAALTGSQDGPAGWALVTLELIRLSEALQNAHTARGELTRAHELHDSAQGLLQLTAAAAQRDPAQRAAHTAEHAQAGGGVIALDRGNVGTITGVDDQAGAVTVQFHNRAEGTGATRTFAWDKVLVLDTTNPRPLSAAAKTHLARTSSAPDSPPAGREAGRQRDFER